MNKVELLQTRTRSKFQKCREEQHHLMSSSITRWWSRAAFLERSQEVEDEFLHVVRLVLYDCVRRVIDRKHVTVAQVAQVVRRIQPQVLVLRSEHDESGHLPRGNDITK